MTDTTDLLTDSERLTEFMRTIVREVLAEEPELVICLSLDCHGEINLRTIDNYDEGIRQVMLSGVLSRALSLVASPDPGQTTTVADHRVTATGKSKRYQ